MILCFFCMAFVSLMIFLLVYVFFFSFFFLHLGPGAVGHYHGTGRQRS
jgi:hypothetical protein